jgi:cell division septation protein DedD
LLALTACSREKNDWHTAQAADTPESYQQFIAAHPDSTLTVTARERLGQLSEEKDWRSAAGTDTLEAYQQFLGQYPNGKWSHEAQVRLDNFAANAPPAGAPATGSASGGRGVSVPATAPAAAASESTASDAMSSGFGVQLGAFSSAERANEEWKKLQKEAAGSLDGLSPRVVVGEASGKQVYRLQAQVRDEVQARAICGGLKVEKKPCVPVVPHGKP